MRFSAALFTNALPFPAATNARRAASFVTLILSSRFKRMHLNVSDRRSRAILCSGGTPSPSGATVSGVGSRTYSSYGLPCHCRTSVSDSLAKNERYLSSIRPGIRLIDDQLTFEEIPSAFLTRSSSSRSPIRYPGSGERSK